MPVYDLGVSTASASSSTKREWVVMTKPHSSSSPCMGDWHCVAEGDAKAGVPFATMSASEDELMEIVKAHPGEIEFIEPSTTFGLDPIETEPPTEDEAPAEESLLDVDGAPEWTEEAKNLGWRMGVPQNIDWLDAPPGGHTFCNQPTKCTKTRYDKQYTPPMTGKGVHVYVFDTGIDIIGFHGANQRDFGGRAIPTIEVAMNGKVTECKPGDTKCAGPAKRDRSHGTHVAGTVGSSLFGSAKNVTLHSVRIFKDGSEAYSTKGLEASKA